MNFIIERDPVSDLILVNIRLDKQGRLSMILDTGCSSTTIDTSPATI